MSALLGDVSREADALGQAFKENQSEIQRLQSIQKDLEVQWATEKIKFDELVVVGNGLVARLCVLEDEKSQTQRNINALEKELDQAIQNYEAIRKYVLDKTGDYEEMERKLSIYVIKMKTYKEDTAEVEGKTPLLQEVAKVKEEIHCLQIKKSELEKHQKNILTNADGVVMTKEQLQAEVVEIKQQIEERKDAYQDKKQQLESAQEKRKGLEMTNFVLTKKNSALLIRMRKKVEEQKEKHSAFVSQRDYLVKMVDTTHQKLERYGDHS